MSGDNKDQMVLLLLSVVEQKLICDAILRHLSFGCYGSQVVTMVITLLCTKIIDVRDIVNDHIKQSEK